MWKHRLINFRALMSGALPGKAASSQSPCPSQRELLYTAIHTFLCLPRTGWQRSRELTTHTLTPSHTPFPLRFFVCRFIAGTVNV